MIRGHISYSKPCNRVHILGQDLLIRIYMQILAGFGLVPCAGPRHQVLFNRLSNLHVHGRVDLGAIFEVAKKCQYEATSIREEGRTLCSLDSDQHSIKCRGIEVLTIVLSWVLSSEISQRETRPGTQRTYMACSNHHACSGV